MVYSFKQFNKRANRHGLLSLKLLSPRVFRLFAKTAMGLSTF